MRIKTSELSNAQLDWAVAKCEGMPSVCIVKKRGKVCVYGQLQGIDFPYQPSTDWAQGGLILERERINLWNEGYDWEASLYGEHQCWGTTPLIAGMRCYVTSKLGDEVETPEGLS